MRPQTGMSLRSRLGGLQLPVAAVGLLVAALAIAQFLALEPAPPDGDGFVRGLAVLFLYVAGVAGFVVAALGFAVPPGDGFGIRFNRTQRRLLVGAALAAFGSLVAPLVAWPVMAATPLGFEGVVWSWVALTALAVLAFVGSLGWRAAEEVARRVDG